MKIANFGHQRLQVLLVRLTHDPVRITTECPTRDRSNQGLLIRQTHDQVGNQLRQVGNHAIHTTCNCKTALAFQRTGKCVFAAEWLDFFVVFWLFSSFAVKTHVTNLLQLLPGRVCRILWSPSPCGTAFLWESAAARAGASRETRSPTRPELLQSTFLQHNINGCVLTFYKNWPVLSCRHTSGVFLWPNKCCHESKLSFSFLSFFFFQGNLNTRVALTKFLFLFWTPTSITKGPLLHRRSSQRCSILVFVQLQYRINLLTEVPIRQSIVVV